MGRQRYVSDSVYRKKWAFAQMSLCIQSFILYLDNILRYNIPYLIMCYGHLCVFFCSGTNKQTKSDIKRQPKRNRKRKQLFGDIFGDNSGFGEISPLKLTKSTNISENDPCVAPAVTVQSKLASIELSNPDSEEDGCTIEPAPSSVIKTILSKPAAVYTDRKIASMRKGDSTAVKQATKCFFCNQLKFKNRNTKLTTIKQPSSSDKVVW